MEKWFYLLFLVIGFGLGYLVADFNHIAPISLKSNITVDAKQSKYNVEMGSIDHAVLLATQQLGTKNNHFKTLSEQQRQQISQIIAAMPEQQIGEYLNKAFPHQDFSMLQDKKRFAQRALEELSTKNDDQKLSGRLVLALTPVMPQQSEDLHQVYQHQGVFAHFDTMGKFPADEQIFIRWLNHDTGEVLLFTPRRISSDSSQNWVSAVPPNGWQVGSYDVKVYQMSDQLIPIAQASYRIMEVL